MDEKIIKKYRELLTQDFPNSGKIDQSSIFVEAVGEKLINCGNTGNYMQLYILISKDRIADIKYLCSCEPVANVVVEVLCSIVKGMTLDNTNKLSEDDFFQEILSREAIVQKKVVGIIDLFNQGLSQIKNNTMNNMVLEKINWDENLNN
jgi:NifU-like protein involved in Fe-S cluster formation